MDEYEKLRSLLLHSEQKKIMELKKSLEALLEETCNPEHVINRVEPLLSVIFKQSIEKDKNNLLQIGQVMAPFMGIAIKYQVKNQKDDIVDALYLVMGNMVSKFVSQAFKEVMLEINQKVQTTFSLEVLKRKVTAKIKGISETELLLQNSSRPYIIQSIFLIHKETGILISERSTSGKESIEPEMVASMLTAIRSFVNDWISKSNDYFELNEIEFGDSTIRLEVAGCCYMAIVLKGNINSKGQLRISKILEKLVEEYSQVISQFDGDRENLPMQEINKKIDSLLDSEVNESRSEQKSSIALSIILCFISFGIFWGVYSHYLSYVAQKKAQSLINNDSKLNIYAISAEVNYSHIVLKGRLPAKSLHERLIKNISNELPKFIIDDQILMSDISFTNEQMTSTIKTIIDTLNNEEGNAIDFKVENETIRLEGMIRKVSLGEKLLMDISKIPGIKRVVSSLQENALAKDLELFYDLGVSKINNKNKVSIDNWIQKSKLKNTLKFYDFMDLQIIGYSDLKGDRLRNLSYASKRAKNIEKYLIQKGLPSGILYSMGVPASASSIINKTLSNNRCVQLK